MHIYIYIVVPKIDLEGPLPEGRNQPLLPSPREPVAAATYLMHQSFASPAYIHM